MSGEANSVKLHLNSAILQKDLRGQGMVAGSCSKKTISNR